jgi:hypothetical protein
MGLYWTVDRVYPGRIKHDEEQTLLWSAILASPRRQQVEAQTAQTPCRTKPSWTPRRPAVTRVRTRLCGTSLAPQNDMPIDHPLVESLAPLVDPVIDVALGVA